jgi:hypothetical protein
MICDELLGNVDPWRIVVMHKDMARLELPSTLPPGLRSLLWSFTIDIEGQECNPCGSSAEELREDLKPYVMRVQNPLLQAPRRGIPQHSSHTLPIREAMESAGRIITHTHFWAAFRNEFQDAVKIPLMTQWAVRHVAESTRAGVSKWVKGMRGRWVWRELDTPLILLFQTDDGLSTALSVRGPAAPIEKQWVGDTERKAKLRKMLGNWEALVKDVAAATGVMPRVPDVLQRLELDGLDGGGVGRTGSGCP